MKRTLLLLSILGFYLSVFSQQPNEFVCRLGFTFEMSQQNSWGKNKPVVLSVQPSSPAEASGIKINDIIVAINDAPTEGKMLNTINDWLLNNPSDQIKLTVSNLSYKNKDITIYKDCKLANAINEKELASVYSFYSLEDIQERSFTCPFKTALNQDANFMNYKTFGFASVDENNKNLENVINDEIKKTLESRGLTYKQNNPDLIVHTYYSYNKNLNYEGSLNAEKYPVACRYNMHTATMENLPIYYHPLINQKQAQFLLNFGIRLIDRNRSSNNNLFVAWECEANEMLSADYKLEAYSNFHIPLMLMQYPYPQTKETAQFRFTKMKYNYTGLNYNINDLKEIIDVDRFSPAYQVSVQPGDEVEKINGIKVENNPQTASSAYKQFIYKTMSLRDSKTTYTNASGFTQCMYWDVFNYAQIADIFKKPEYATTYSYLFYFEPYINLSGTNIITFDIKRGKQKISLKVTPVINTESSFENYR